jgi:hypothetical protein
MCGIYQIVTCTNLLLNLWPEINNRCIQLLLVLEVLLKIHLTIHLDFTHILKFPVPLQDYLVLLRCQALCCHFVLQSVNSLS